MEDSYYVTPLHAAAGNGNLEMVKYLAELIEGNNNPSGYKGFTPLHVAASRGHLNVVKYYTKQLQNPNPKGDEATPLHVAAQMGHLAIVKHLCNMLE